MKRSTLLAVFGGLLIGLGSPASLAAEHPGYSTTENPPRDATGKVYMGRMISHVMGHQGASWLERAEREREENVSRLIELLQVKPGDKVADIGVGSGYHTRRIAPLIEPEGKVYAVDIQPEMLAILAKNLEKVGITNVVSVLGDIDDPNLPSGEIDMAFMVDVYHECSHPYEMIAGICEALKPGGRLILVEYRLEDESVPIKRLHKMSAAQVKKEMEPHPLQWVSTDSTSLPWQHVIVFEKTE
ncbi:MAG: class I SAM-dependent methyltransferase [Synoicihabitans sp.]